MASLHERGVEVVADQNEDDTVRAAVARVIAGPADLVDASRVIAERLDQVQTGRNPAGLLAVIAGTVDGKRCASVLKLEREQGLRFRIKVVGGRHVVDLEFLRDLTLTDKTKVFKTLHEHILIFAKPSERKTRGPKVVPYDLLMQDDRAL